MPKSSGFPTWLVEVPTDQSLPLVVPVTGAISTSGVDGEHFSGVELASGEWLVAWSEKIGSGTYPDRATFSIGKAPDWTTLVGQDDSVDPTTIVDLITVSDGATNQAYGTIMYGPDGSLFLVLRLVNNNTFTYHASFETPTRVIGVEMFLYRSDDEGDTWDHVFDFTGANVNFSTDGEGFGSGPSNASEMVEIPGTSTWVISIPEHSAYVTSFSTGQCIWYSTDSGASWTKSNAESVSVYDNWPTRNFGWSNDNLWFWDNYNVPSAQQNLWWSPDGITWDVQLKGSAENSAIPIGGDTHLWVNRSGDWYETDNPLPDDPYSTYWPGTLLESSTYASTVNQQSYVCNNGGYKFVVFTVNGVLGFEVPSPFIAPQHCMLHIPHPLWLAEGDIRKLEENWHEVETWATRHMTSSDCRPCANATVADAPKRCWFHVPDPTAPSRYGREQNWLAIERWANTVVKACYCYDCSSTVDWHEACNLHIPHASTDDPLAEQQNWLELERWTVRLRACTCVT